MSSNDNTKFADWVAYRLDKDSVSENAETKRKWEPDPWLEDSETLEPSDYKDANKVLKKDRGHQAPLASFKGTAFWFETNYLSNITPQKSASLPSKIPFLSLLALYLKKICQCCREPTNHIKFPAATGKLLSNQVKILQT